MMRSFVIALAMGLAIQPQQAVGDWTIGCYRLDNRYDASRDDTKPGEVGVKYIISYRANSVTTRSSCRTQCGDAGFNLAALYDGTQCRCGDLQEFYSGRSDWDKRADKWCNVLCGGDDDYDDDGVLTCGGTEDVWLIGLN